VAPSVRGLDGDEGSEESRESREAEEEGGRHYCACFLVSLLLFSGEMGARLFVHVGLGINLGEGNILREDPRSQDRVRAARACERFLCSCV